MRAPWDSYFMDIARTVATRATCLRKHVGAVIVRDKTIVSTGYNGSIRGMPHCDEPGVGCLMEDGHCCRTVHAEANAILQAAKNGSAIDGATLYSTASPCWPCFGLVANSGIRRIVFGEAYRAGDPGPKRVSEVAKLAGIELVMVTPPDVVFVDATNHMHQHADAAVEAAAKRIGLDLSQENPVLALGQQMLKAQKKFQCSNCDWTGMTTFRAGCPKCQNKMLLEVP